MAKLNFNTAPNRYGLDPFYRHVWARKPNRNGMFADWNPDVSGEATRNKRREAITSRRAMGAAGTRTPTTHYNALYQLSYCSGHDPHSNRRVARQI